MCVPWKKPLGIGMRRQSPYVILPVLVLFVLLTQSLPMILLPRLLRPSRNSLPRLTPLTTTTTTLPPFRCRLPLHSSQGSASSSSTAPSSSASAAPPLVTVITGPTSVGKSLCALSLSLPPPSAILSADSVQLYDELTVGANKPTPSELSAAPHLFVGGQPLNSSRDDEGSSTAMKWLSAASFALASPAAGPGVHPRVVCGGSSMYVDWLLNGAPCSPGYANGTEDGRRMREAVDDAVGRAGLDEGWEEGVERVYGALVAGGGLDGLKGAEREELRRRFGALTRNDVYRLTRAAEVGLHRSKFGGEGPLFSAERSGVGRAEVEFRPFFLCPSSRWEHCRAIDARCESMIGKGLLSEVGSLAAHHGLLSSPVRLAIGYRQTLEYLQAGDASPEAFPRLPGQVQGRDQTLRQAAAAVVEEGGTIARLKLTLL